MSGRLIEVLSGAGGELGRLARARSDIERYAISRESLENFLPVAEGALTRAPGTKFVLPLKNEAQKGKLVPMRFSSSDSAMLVFNAGAMRVLKDGGFIGAPYELVTPFVEADLPNLRWASSGNVIYIADKKKPQLLTRISNTNFTITDYLSKNGPVNIQNVDVSKTIQASLREGTTTLTPSGFLFDAGQVGSVWRLDESDLSLIANWKANESITIPTENVPVGGTSFAVNFTSPDAAFDGNAATGAVCNATGGSVGRTLTTPSAIYNVFVRHSAAVSGSDIVNLSLYAKNGAAPTSLTDGTLLGTVQRGVNTGIQYDDVIYSNDSSRTWQHFWVVFVSGNGVLTQMTCYIINPVRFTSTGTPVLRRYQGRVFQAISGSNTGINPPTHDEGDVLSETGGVVWRYRHDGAGYARLTAVAAGGVNATALVVRTLPDSVTLRPTYRWYEGEWCDKNGWPAQVALHKQRLVWTRGDKLWATRPNSQDDYHLNGLDDSALAVRLTSPHGSLVVIEWLMSSGVLMIGTRDLEFVLRAPDKFGVLRMSDLQVPDASEEGSAPQIPARVDGGAIFLGKSKKRLHFARFNRESEEVDPEELSMGARHILKANGVAFSWQRDPHRVLWMQLEDGTLASLTFMPKQKVVAFARHPMANAFIEDIAEIPTTDEGRNDVYFIVRRTIQGSTRRYVEQLMPFFEPLDEDEPTAEAAWFVDCGLRYQGAASKTIGGLGHLAGQTVAVLANGAEHERVVVSAGGVITLTRAVTDAIVGIPRRARIKDLPRNITTQAGSTKGTNKRTPAAVMRLEHSVGGRINCNGGDPVSLFPTGGAPAGAPLALMTGELVKTCGGKWENEAAIELDCDNALPFTLLELSPRMEMGTP